MGGSDIDLFGKFNEGKVGEVLSRCANCGRFVVMGPPRSGKSFFIENYLRGSLGNNVTIDEHTLGIHTATKTVGGLGLRKRVMRLLKRMMPWIRKLVDEVGVEVEEVRVVIGNRAPRPVVEEAMRRIGDSPHMAYYIPWDRDEVGKCVDKPSACAFGVDVGKALKLIKDAFGDRRIKWFEAEYIPPGLVKEVIDLVKEKGEEGARGALKDWVDAYFKAIETLSRVLGMGEDLLRWEESSVAFLSSFVNNLASYVIGGLAAIPISAAALATIAVFTHMAFKREGEGYLREIIELRRSLEGLLVKGPDGRLDFNELGRLLVYRVAYAMGMSYGEAKEALMYITGLSMDELERRVNEIKGRIEEVEKKIELFRQEVPAGIVTADANEFAKGVIYPNIKVDGGRLRIRVEDLEDRYYNMVKAGKFNELVNGVRGRLMNDGVVVIVGPKGIGKSTLAAATVWELLSNYEVRLVARVDVLNENNYSRFKTFIENYSKELLILYDPVSTETYEEEPGTQPQRGQGESAKTSGKVRRVRYVKMPRDVEATIANLINASSELGDLRPPILIVLPSDVYNALSEEVRNALEKHRLDASQGLINTEFLAELIREYSRTRDKPSGCELSSDVLNALASNVARFDSGHALMARLIGEELARNNCNVGKIEELINNAKGRAEAFIILHMNGLFKVHEDPDTAKALVEIFALRRPFVNSVNPGNPILTPGIIELISEEKDAKMLYGAEGGELRGWLAHRQHDLIEETIKRMLKCVRSGGGEKCENLGDALKPWIEAHVPKIRNRTDAVKYFTRKYRKRFIKKLRRRKNCWKRAALIIGHDLAGRGLVPRPEDLPGYVVESLGDALRGCGVDDYLLVGNETPPLIEHLTYTRVSAEAFINRYDEAVAEVNRVFNIARDRGGITITERFYGLGLASIIASAAGLGRPVKSGDADAALYIASFAIQYVVLPHLIMPILRALKPLHDKAPHRYIDLLALAVIENLDHDTVRYIFNELNKILDNYGDRVKGYAWSLVHAIDAYANLLGRHRRYFDDEEVGGVVGRVVGLLSELGRFKSSLGIIAWAIALAPALDNEDVRGVMEERLGIDVVGKASEVLGGLGKLREMVQELMRDEEFMSYVESIFVKADEKAVRKEILETALLLKHALAIYRLHNDELGEAASLFGEAAEESREIGDYENYLVDRSWALRVETIEGSLVSGKLVDEFRQLYEETFNEEHFKYTAPYFSIASDMLGNYLVSLALTGDDKTISKLLEEHWWVLNVNYEVSVLTRLMLNALLDPRDELSSGLGGRFVVKPRELIEAFKDEINSEFLSALMVTFGVIKPEDGIRMCVSIKDFMRKRNCKSAVLVAKGNSTAVERLREGLIDIFHKRILEGEVVDLLRGLGFDAESLFDEFKRLVDGLNCKSLVQLIAPRISRAQLALMLHALINGDEKLAKAHALYGAVGFFGKLLSRLLLDVYKACEKDCNLNNENLRQAAVKLFLYYI